MKAQSGFTLIELMIAIGIVSILAAIAVPSYVDYATRANIPEAASMLADQRVKLEQYFQDNRTYVGACMPGTVAPLPQNGKNFTPTCPTLTATTFEVRATGSGRMTGFVFLINHNNRQWTLVNGAAAAAGYVSNDECWVRRKGAGAAAC
jgi:type IV pilus assembly protein PilE